MQSFDMLLDTTREFMHRTAAFLPRLVMAVVVVLIGYLLAKLRASRWSVRCAR